MPQSDSLRDVSDTVPCPSCRQGMVRLTLSGRLHGAIDTDLCFSCQGIWFDSFESARISPAGIVELFRLIHEHRDEPGQSLAGRLSCPRCKEDLAHVRDIGKSGRFNYFRCGQDHGRFTPFAQFMIEKGFVRQLAPAEVQTVAAQISSIHCNGCGAPFDIRKDAACPYCRAPIAILDPQAVERALAEYRKTANTQFRHNPVTLPDMLRALEHEHPTQAALYSGDESTHDLVAEGLRIVWEFLGDRVG